MGGVVELTADYSMCPAGGKGGQGAWEEVKGLVSVLPKLMPSGTVCWVELSLLCELMHCPCCDYATCCQLQL